MILDQMRHIQAVRAGTSTEEGFSRVMSELESQLKSLDGNDAIEQNWEDLKAIGKG